jgi:hypothetical protein
MTRERLPNRRAAITESMNWGNDRLHVSVGFANDGRILEVFVTGAKVGSDRDHLLDDAAVTISRLLQHGDQLLDIANGIGRLPGGEPASMVGAVVDRLVAIAASVSPAVV